VAGSIASDFGGLAASNHEELHDFHVVVSDEQEFEAHHATSKVARRDVMRRLALATGLQRAVELADQVNPLPRRHPEIVP
jgi:hypothetical protein